MLPLSEVQTAIYAALVPAVAPVPVLDLAGPDQEYPYVTIGEFTGSNEDTLNDECVRMELTIHVWSRQAGMRETQQIMEAVKDTLHRQRFDIADPLQWVMTVWEFAQTLRDADGVTRHGVLRFSVTVFQPAAIALVSGHH